MTNANNKQVAGDHYKKYGDLQPWDVVIKWNLGYLEGTALKYIARWRDKGGIADIQKAIHFLEKLVEVEKEKQLPVQEVSITYHWDIEDVQRQWVARNEAEKVINEDLSQR